MTPACHRGIPLNSRRWLIYVAVATLLAILTAAAAIFASDAGRQAYAEFRARSPQSIIRYAQRRLQGHDKLEWLLLPALHALQRRIERAPPPGPLPALGKGQQTAQMAPLVADMKTVLRASSAAEIIQALLHAEPGTRIVIAPGHYRFDNTLRLGKPGLADAPIAVSAIVPGTVRLDFSHDEGILIDRPHWVFENLNIQGTCTPMEVCEHAFHVVGAGAFTVLRNNHLQDFNAHIKVNGLNGHWPDHGLVAFNTLTNSAARQTDKPVVMFDLVGAHHWKVQDNLVTSFAKRGGHGVAYGLFMKGASEGGRIERNLVICSPDGMSEPGERVGISFGGGRTGPESCRTDACRDVEHRNGLAANNIVAHCNDSGMDINHASQIALAHNTLINTAGFSIRGGSTQVRLLGNLYEGSISAIESDPPISEWNLIANPSALFMNAEALFFQWIELPKTIPLELFVTNDFRGARRNIDTIPGALERDFQGETHPSPRR